MNPQTLIIAPPASGKSGVDTLNKQVMSVLRAQDQISRNALKEYKRKRKERTTSSKEQKQAALVEPQRGCGFGLCQRRLGERLRACALEHGDNGNGCGTGQEVYDG